MNNNINLLCGDSIEILKTLDTNSVDLVVTDPPYNLNKDYGTSKDNLQFNEYLNFTRKWLEEIDRVLKPNGTIYIFMGMRFISYLYMILEQDMGYSFNSWITWHYTQGIGKKKGFSPRHDDILMFTKNKNNFVFNLDDVRIPQKCYRSTNNMRGSNPGNVWEFSHIHYCNKKRTKHPTQKPEGLFERMILASSNEEDVILDPFLGSGTTARVCQQLNRKCIGIDINPEYIKIAKSRLNEEFLGFDSFDERIKRIPTNLNSKNGKEYLKNHKKWFLKNHKQIIQEFENKKE